jgi:tetratricopeptide (TPR) repeat protein
VAALMATKAKPKTKPTKKLSGRAPAAAKSLPLNPKAAKSTSSNGSRNGSKAAAKESLRRPVKVASAESRRTSVAAAASASARSVSPERDRQKHFVSAIQSYEAGIRLMHAEEFEKAIRCFNELIAEHPEEPEIQERAKVLIHASEKKIQEKGRTVLRSADDHYNVAIAQLNRRELDSAMTHLQQALKLMPKGDHILYALATASALQGNREQALGYLKQSIHHRGENRFLAARDSDFESLHDDSDFKQLLTSSEK